MGTHTYMAWSQMVHTWRLSPLAELLGTLKLRTTKVHKSTSGDEKVKSLEKEELHTRILRTELDGHLNWNQDLFYK